MKYSQVYWASFDDGLVCIMSTLEPFEHLTEFYPSRANSHGELVPAQYFSSLQRTVVTRVI